VHSRITNGIIVDADILRLLLGTQLVAANRGNMLIEQGGVHAYGRAWAYRFFDRHNLPCRVVTTKMRERP